MRQERTGWKYPTSAARSRWAASRSAAGPAPRATRGRGSVRDCRPGRGDLRGDLRPRGSRTRGASARLGGTALLSEERNRLLCETGPEPRWVNCCGATGTHRRGGEFSRRAVKAVRIMGEDWSSTATGAAITAWWTGTARTAAPTWRTASSRTAGCAATTTAGCSTTPAVPASAVRGDAAPGGPLQGQGAHQGVPGRRRRPGCSGPTWGRSRRRCCPTGTASTRDGFKQIAISEIPCNWFQCQENSIDPVHFEWMHAQLGTGCCAARTAPARQRHRGSASTSSTTGSPTAASATTPTENDELWTIGRVCLWPNCLYTAATSNGGCPIDDEHTLSVALVLRRAARRRSRTSRTDSRAGTAPVTGRADRPLDRQATS